MISKTELRYLLALQRTPHLGDASVKKLLNHVGSAEGVFKEKRSNLLRIDGIGSSRIGELDAHNVMDAVEAELAFMEKEGIDAIYFREEEYPERLKHCQDGPVLFFQKGNPIMNQRRVLSVVGTRRMTSYGRKICREIIEDLAPLNPVIVSGFAYGVDITAHTAALDNNLQTVACLAHGFNELYPKTHKKYVQPIMEQGGFMTEFWSDDAFDRTNFLKRNRIIAGLSEATLVIESAEKGGSLVTADIANSYNREVFAVPGRAGDAQSRGCNALIKSQQAHLVTSAADIVYLLNWEVPSAPPKATQTNLFVEMNDDETTIYTFLKIRGKELLDIIALECKMPTHKVASLLLTMELKGLVKPLPGKMFEAG